MKRYKMMPVVLFFIGLSVLSFIFGYTVVGKRLATVPKNIEEINQKEAKLPDYPDMEILKENDKISPNAMLEKRIHYSSCNHVVTKIDPIGQEFINMSKQEFIEYMANNHSDKRLISYSDKKITIGVNKNHLCEKHYIIGEEKGKISIFKIDENGERVLDKIFYDYPISLLMEIDQEKIIEGIVIDSEEELSEVLENFIS